MDILAMNTALDQLYAALAGQDGLQYRELLFLVEQATQQRDRLLWGVNARSSELDTLKQEHALLRERYRLLEQRHTQLAEIGRQLQEELKKAKYGKPPLSDGT